MWPPGSTAIVRLPKDDPRNPPLTRTSRTPLWGGLGERSGEILRGELQSDRRP